MAIQFICPSCGQPIEVDDELANELVTCPFCHRTATTPGASDLTAKPTTTMAPEARPEPVGGHAAPALASVPVGEERVRGNVYSWIALGCVALAMVCTIAGAYMMVPFAERISRAGDPAEQTRIVEEMQEELGQRPGTLASLTFGWCVFPLAGLAFAIVALVRRSRPRWPAIVALCLIGGSFMFVVLASVVGSGIAPAS